MPICATLRCIAINPTRQLFRRRERLSGRSFPALPKRQRPEDEKRSDDRGNDVPQRDPDAVESGEQPKQPEQQTTDQGAGRAQPQIAPYAEAPALAPDDQPGDAASEQTNDYPYDELGK